MYLCMYALGTGFPVAERERLGLRGLLPPRVVSMQVQVGCGAAQECVRSDLVSCHL